LSQKPLRVLHFYKTSFPDTMGGIEQFINQISRGCVKSGFEIDVLSLSDHKDLRTIEIDGYSVHRVRLDFQIASTSFSICAFWRFFQLAKQADIIHYHYPWPFMDMVHFVTRVCKPTVVTYHSDIIRQVGLLKIYGPLKNKFLSSVSSIVATSPNYMASSAVLEKYSDKVKQITYGLDKAAYPQPDDDRLAFWRARVSDKFFLFIGVLRYYKGLHILLEAADGSNYPIVIVGAGPIEQELHEQALKLGLRNIHFLGYQTDEDKVALLILSYAVIFPSHLRSEAFGISLLEGAMYGKPLISSEIGTGTTYINVSDETGLVVPPSDPDALRQAMIYLWEHPEQAAEMGKRAEKRYWQLFTSEQMVQSYIKLYREIQDNIY
jgi:O-antigen biosynthesis rhamnosyltransferase